MVRQRVYKQMSEYQPRLPSNNAYDYYISAARQLKKFEVYTSNQPPTREEVRWVEDNQGAFHTLRQGYHKPYHWPFREIGWDFAFDDLARVRHLARLVNTRIRWAIATKDRMDAVSDWRIGFKMARDMQGDLILVYLVGMAVEAIVHAPIIREMDFFSAHECRELACTLIESERAPHRINTVVEGELASTLFTVAQLLPEGRVNALALSAFLGFDESGEKPEDDSKEEDPEARQRVERLKQEFQRLLQHPTAYQRLRNEVLREINRRFQALSDSFTLQGGRWRPIPDKEYDMNTLFGYLTEHLTPSPGIAMRYWSTRARRRLMIAHLLLREYYLREGHYPTSLKELKLKELELDPFSGHPFIYRLMSERYQLYSVGEDGKDDGGHNPKPVEGTEPEQPRDLFLIRGGWR